MELYGRSISEYANMHRRDLNVTGLGTLDFRTLKEDGQPWDFTKRADRKLARELINKLDPEWVLGAPPCTAFSLWNHGINYKKINKEKVHAMMEEGRLHLRFACSLYRRQIARSKFFLHEHPTSAFRSRALISSVCQLSALAGCSCKKNLPRAICRR